MTVMIAICQETALPSPRENSIRKKMTEKSYEE